MPTYEYRCDQCSHQFEVFASMSDPAPEACEACGASGTLSKVLFPVAVHYKGSGFYSTDYKGGSKAGTGTASTDGGSGSSSDSGSASSATAAAGSTDSGSSSSTSNDA